MEKGLYIQESSSEIMRCLVQDLLDYAQIKAGKFRQNITTFNIRNSVEKVMSIQRLNAEKKGISFEVEYENIAKDEAHANGREGRFSPIIKCDEQRIMQVLLGLQSNALKFTRTGRVKIYTKIVESGALNSE